MHCRSALRSERRGDRTSLLLSLFSARKSRKKKEPGPMAGLLIRFTIRFEEAEVFFSTCRGRRRGHPSCRDRPLAFQR